MGLCYLLLVFTAAAFAMAAQVVWRTESAVQLIHHDVSSACHQKRVSRLLRIRVQGLQLLPQLPLDKLAYPAVCLHLHGTMASVWMAALLDVASLAGTSSTRPEVASASHTSCL